MAGSTGATGVTGPAEIGGYPNIRTTPIYVVASQNDGVQTITSASSPGVNLLSLEAGSIIFSFREGTFGEPGANYVNLSLQGYMYVAGQGYQLLEAAPAIFVPVNGLGGGAFFAVDPGNFTNRPFMFVVQHAY